MKLPAKVRCLPNTVGFGKDAAVDVIHAGVASGAGG